MSGYAQAPHKPDNRIFASYPMPAKIDLIQERPRRESLVEKQLEGAIGQTFVPKLDVSNNPLDRPANQQPNVWRPSTKNDSSMIMQYRQPPRAQQLQRADIRRDYGQPGSFCETMTTTTVKTTNTSAQNAEQQLRVELANKERKLMAEIEAMDEQPYDFLKAPPRIHSRDNEHQQRVIRNQQYQKEFGPSPRSSSRASSTRSTGDDLMEKESKLLRDIEELERKPFNPQTIIVDSNRVSKDSGGQYDGSARPASAASSVHTAVIRIPSREVDNRSPLPFSFDNFSTKGVRGNIASVCALEPERPPPPIFPILKRTPSPSGNRD